MNWRRARLLGLAAIGLLLLVKWVGLVGGWLDIADVWQPWEKSTAYRLGLPGTFPLVVTCTKHAGGMHGRGWHLAIQSAQVAPSEPLRLVFPWDSRPQLPWLEGKQILGERWITLTSEGIPWDPWPGLYVRSYDTGWRVMSYQSCETGSAAVELVPTSKLVAGQDTPNGQGYFVFQVDGQGNVQSWRPCNFLGEPW